MLDKDNIKGTSASETVRKNPTDEQDYCKCSFRCFTLHSYSIQRADQQIAIIKRFVYLLGWVQFSYKIAEDILNKISTEKDIITGIWLVLSTVEVRKKFTGFQSSNKLADTRKEVACYMGA